MNSLMMWKTISFFLITLLFSLLFSAELIMNQITHSLVILSDCYFNMFISMTLLLTLMSNRMTNSVSLRATFGWARIEILGALFNIIFILAMCFSVFVEGILNLIHSSHHESQATNPLYLLIPGINSLALNLFRCLFFKESSRTQNLQLSIRGEEVQVNCVVNGEYEIVNSKATTTKTGYTEEKEEDENDKLLINSNIKPEEFTEEKENLLWKIIKSIGTSLLLIGASISLRYFDGDICSIIDSLTGLAGIVIILSMIYPSMKESGLILLQTVPKHIEVDQVKDSLRREFPIILEIHDFHVWCLTRDKIIATCHISLPSLTTNSYMILSDQICKFLLREGITLTTVQPEFPDESKINGGCLYICSKGEKNCLKKTCCSTGGDDDDNHNESHSHHRHGHNCHNDMVTNSLV